MSNHLFAVEENEKEDEDQEMVEEAQRRLSLEPKIVSIIFEPIFRSLVILKLLLDHLLRLIEAPATAFRSEMRSQAKINSFFAVRASIR